MFIILFLWQMPHFLSIAILYRDDYAAAGFRMLPVADENLSVSTRQILLYSVTLMLATLLPILLRMAGGIYLFAALSLGVFFCCAGIAFARSKRRANARRLFIASIIYLPILLASMAIDKL